MSEKVKLPASLVEPALVRLQRLEHALAHVSGAVDLVRADIDMADGEIDPLEREQLTAVREALSRIASHALLLDRELEETLGGESSTTFIEAPAEPTREVSSLIDETPVVDLTSPEQPETLPETSAPVTHETTIEEIDLYKAILPIEQIPVMQVQEGEDPVVARIIADNTLDLNGTKVRLEGDKLFLFNAFMLLRQGMIRRQAVLDLNFKPGSSKTTMVQAFKREFAKLIPELNEAARVELIKTNDQEGRDARYAVNPNLQFEDVRPPAYADDDLKKN